MSERDLSQQLDLAVAAMLSAKGDGRGFGSTSPEVTELIRVAAVVRDLPDEDFRARLKRDVITNAITSQATQERTTMTTIETATETTSEKTTTSKPWLRPGLGSLLPYLHSPRSANLPDFMKGVFGATELMRALRPDGAIMHAEYRIGDSVIELGEDPPAAWAVGPTPLHVYLDDVDATYARALAAGATSLGEPTDHEYGERGAGFRDGAGNHWWVAKAFTPEHTAGLRSVNVYLHTQDTPAYIDFLKRAFGAKEEIRHEMGGKIAHARIWLGDTILEMGEAREPYGPMPCALHFYVPDTDAVYAQALTAGATSLQEPNDAPYGDRAAAVVDPQGNHWYIATYLNRQV
jgi:PhnB protein